MYCKPDVAIWCILAVVLNPSGRGRLCICICVFVYLRLFVVRSYIAKLLQYGAYLHQFWPQWEGTPLYLCICVFVFVYLRLSAVFCKVVAIWCILAGIDPRERGRLCICMCVFVFVYFCICYCKVVATWCILAGIDPRGRGHLCGPRLAPHAQPHSVLTLVTAFLLPFSFATFATVFSQFYICLVLIYLIVFFSIACGQHIRH